MAKRKEKKLTRLRARSWAITSRYCIGGRGAGISHHRYAGNQLYALRDERHRLPRAAGDRRLQARPPQAAVHDVRDGPAQGQPHQSRQHRGQHHAPEPPRRRRPSTTRWCAWAAATRACWCPSWTRKGNFGKAYSRDMAYAAARYTEAKLEPVCDELFRDIDKDTVDFVPNYDGTTTEPTLLPVTFPTILANNTLGIAVGMASNICSFNLAELCNATIALMKDPQSTICGTSCRPRISSGGGTILYDAAEMQNVLRKWPRQRPRPRSVELRQGKQLHRRHADPAHDDGRSHHGQDHRAGQSWARSARSAICATRPT